MKLRTLVVATAMAFTLLGCGGSDDDNTSPVVVTPDAPSLLTVTRQTIVVGGVEREYFEYVPTTRDARREVDAKNISIVISLHRAGEDGRANAQETRWHEVAEEQGLIAIFPSAIAGKWNVGANAAAANDIAYIDALQAAVRAQYGGVNSMTYLAGIGQGASMANQVAMTVPRVAVALAAQSGVAPVDFMQAPPVAFKPAAVATWLFREGAQSYSSAEARTVNFWQQANAVGPTPELTADLGGTTVYRNSANPRQELRISSTTPGSRYGKDITLQIWNGMFSKVVRLLDNNTVAGTLVAPMTIADMKLVDVTKTLATGASRRWLEYVPSNYAALTANGNKIPVLFSYHGRNGSARWQAFLTQWHVLAEKYGFIVVYPQGIGATWITSIAADNTDVADFRALLADVETRYAVDTTRRYLTGVSQGSAFTNRVAVQFPELFAAIAPCYSGHLSAAGYANAIVKTSVPLPTWQCRGVDEVPSDFPGSEADGRKFWRETVNGQFGPATVQVDGIFTTEIFNAGRAEYRYTVAKNVGHFWATGLQNKLWTEMFSRYRRMPDGSSVLVQ